MPMEFSTSKPSKNPDVILINLFQIPDKSKDSSSEDHPRERIKRTEGSTLCPTQHLAP